MDRGAWQVTVLGVTKSQIQLKQLCMHIHSGSGILRLWFPPQTHIHKFILRKISDKPQLRDILQNGVV